MNNPLTRKKRAYKALFIAPNGGMHDTSEIVLADLAKFCCAKSPATRRDSLGRVDPIATAQVAAKQEVWHRIQAMIHLPEQMETRNALTPYADETMI